MKVVYNMTISTLIVTEYGGEKMPKAFSDEEKSAIHLKLMELGNEYFGRYGFQKTSIDDIVREAGISKGAFYLFFASKEEYFFGVMDYLDHKVKIEVMKNLDVINMLPFDLFCRIIRNIFEMLLKYPVVKEILMSGVYEQILRKLPPEKIQAHERDDHQFFHNVIDLLKSKGVQIKVDDDEFIKRFSYIVIPIFTKNSMTDHILDLDFDEMIEIALYFSKLLYQDLVVGENPAS